MENLRSTVILGYYGSTKIFPLTFTAVVLLYFFKSEFGVMTRSIVRKIPVYQYYVGHLKNSFGNDGWCLVWQFRFLENTLEENGTFRVLLSTSCKQEANAVENPPV